MDNEFLPAVTAAAGDVLDNTVRIHGLAACGENILDQDPCLIEILRDVAETLITSSSHLAELLDANDQGIEILRRVNEQPVTAAGISADNTVELIEKLGFRSLLAAATAVDPPLARRAVADRKRLYSLDPDQIVEKWEDVRLELIERQLHAGDGELIAVALRKETQRATGGDRTPKVGTDPPIELLAALSRKQQGILCCLWTPLVVDRDEFVQEVWSEPVTEDAVDKAVYRLRTELCKLRTKPNLRQYSEIGITLTKTHAVLTRPDKPPDKPPDK